MRRLIFIISCSLLTWYNGFAQDLSIHEVLSSTHRYYDADGELSDWIELYNSGASPISLSNYKLHDRNNAEGAWVFPEQSINPGEYLLVWASGKNMHGLELHTNFKLSENETLYLFSNQDELLDSLTVFVSCPDVSFGVGESDYVYFNVPTPGSKNSDQEYLGVLENTISYSKNGGQVAPGPLELGGAGQEEQIRFTTDGSEPNENSPLYTSPISISNNFVIRTRLYREAYIPSKSSSRTYVVEDEHALPLVSIVTDPKNFFDIDSGIYVLGSSHASQFPFFGANFWEDWERPIHISLYEENGNLAFETNAGTKIFGGWSRANDQRSLSVFMRGKYGLSELPFKLFPELPYQTFQTFVLRNAGNDFLKSNMRDITLTSLMRGSGLSFPAYKPVVMYLNGSYWGMYNLREKINEHFIASKYGVNAKEIDLLEFSGSPILGDSTEYLALMNFVAANSLVSEQNYKTVEDQIDVENYLIYNVAQIYFDNTDWPGNNVKFWKSPETKWRWILFDTDFGFGIWSSFNHQNNTLRFALEANGPVWPNPPWSTLLFRKCIQNLGFRNKFINRFADELNSRFLPAQVSQHITFTGTKLSSEIDRHYQRWGSSPSIWNQNLNDMRFFGNNRPASVKSHILSEFNLPAYHRLTIELSNPAHGYVYINRRLKAQQNSWRGDYFETVPIELHAVAKPGYVFSHWENAVNATTSKLFLDVDSPKTLRAVFQEAPQSETAIINEINYNSSQDFDTKDWIELYNNSSQVLDLSAWVLKDNDDLHAYTFPAATLLESDSYIVISKNLNAFNQVHPDVTNVLGGLNFGLSSDSDQVRLFNSSGILQDSVSYSSNAPWPVLANGEGYTLELKMPELDNEVAENWSHIHLNGSPGITNLDVSSVENTLHGIDLLCFPNPVIKRLTIQLSLEESKDVGIGLYNLDGLRIKEIFDGPLDKGQHTLNLVFDQIPSGSYLLRIHNNENQHLIKKIIKL